MGRRSDELGSGPSGSGAGCVLELLRPPQAGRLRHLGRIALTGVSPRELYVEFPLTPFHFSVTDSTDVEWDLEAREPEPEPEPLHIPLISNWMAGRKQAKEDRERGAAMRKLDEAIGGAVTGVSPREL